MTHVLDGVHGETLIPLGPLAHVKNWKQDEIWSSPQGSTEQANTRLHF